MKTDRVVEQCKKSIADLARQSDIYKALMITAIRENVDKHLHDSGYCNSGLGDTGHVQLCTFGKNEEDEVISFRDDSTELCVEGYTGEGIITEVWVGLCVLEYTEASLEELLFAYQVAISRGAGEFE